MEKAAARRTILIGGVAPLSTKIGGGGDAARRG